MEILNIALFIKKCVVFLKFPKKSLTSIHFCAKSSASLNITSTFMKKTSILTNSLISFGFAASVSASTITWVPVGDPGNAADTTGRGAVGYNYSITKFEFTNAQYANFLNSVDLTGANPYNLYNASMANVYGGIRFISSNSSGSKYVVKPNFGDKPVNYVSWFDAARVANWVNNGATVGADTETGAYTLNGATSGSTVARNAGAAVFLPSQDEWYKAAFYKSGGTSAGYWEYATQSETAPGTVTADAFGVGSAGSSGNFANYLSGAVWNSANGNVTSVGTNGGRSAYGTFDMIGNVREVVETTPGTNAVWRGGSFVGSLAQNSATSGFQSVVATNENHISGFRLASVPEPGSTIPLLTLFALGMAKSRRRKA
jgi:formylglycine-generating enzyme required for sulfatase activity